MTSVPDPDISLDVDLRNPGQFFACCGVLELASRLWPGSEGWFGKDLGLEFFHVATRSRADDAMGQIIGHLCAEEPLVDLAEDHEFYAGDRKPVMLKAPFDLRLDWWLDSYRGGDKSELKVWAGQMTPRGNLAVLQTMLRRLHEHVDPVPEEPRFAENPGLLVIRIPGSGMGIDPATSWTAINVGFSPDEQDVDVLASPATEILAMIGLQRCRPVMDRTQRRRWFIYRAWADPLEINVAPAAIAGAGRAIDAYAFPVEMRNSQYGNFGWAKRWEDEG